MILDIDYAELDRQVAIIVAARAKLCNVASIDAAFVTIAAIAARAELVRVRRVVDARRAIQLPLPLPETTAA